MFHAIDLFWIAHGQFEAILATQGRLLMFSDQDQCDQRSNRVNWSKAMRKTRSFDHQLFVNCYAHCVMCTTFSELLKPVRVNLINTVFICLFTHRQVNNINKNYERLLNMRMTTEL